MLEKDRKNSLMVTYFIFFLDNFGLAVVFNFFAPLIFLPEYKMISFETTIQTKNFLLAILMVSFPIMQFIGGPIIGDIADILGRKKALYLTLLGLFAGFIFSALSIYFHHYTALVASRFISGFFAGNLSICTAIIGDLSEDETTRAKNFGKISLIAGGSWILAMIVGGYLSNPNFFNPSLIFWITAFFSLFSFFLVKYKFKETHMVEKGKKVRLLGAARDILTATKIKSTRLIYLIYAFFIIGQGLSLQWLSPFLLQSFHISENLATICLTISGITWAYGSYFLNNYLVTRFETKNIIKYGILITTIILIISSILQSYFIAFVIILSLSSIFAAFSWSNIMNYISSLAPENIRGTVMGIAQSILSLSFILVPIIGGILGGTNIKYIYPLSAILILISFFLTFLIKNKTEEIS